MNSAAPLNPPDMAFLVMDHRGQPCFVGKTFERAAERVTALMRGECSNDYGAPTETFFQIVKVEAE